jgi:hypothetical protein
MKTNKLIGPQEASETMDTLFAELADIYNLNKELLKDLQV